MIPDHLPVIFDGRFQRVLRNNKFAQALETLDPGGVDVVRPIFAGFGSQVHPRIFHGKNSAPILWLIYHFVGGNEVKVFTLKTCN